MPYRITRHTEDLLWVVFEGHLTMDQANAYFKELWALFDACTQSADLLVDGRKISGGSPAVRQRMEQVVHHPRLRHLAFVVSEQHLLFFAPLVKMVSGIGLFGNETDALNYLRSVKAQPPVRGLMMPSLPPLPGELQKNKPHAANGAHPSSTHATGQRAGRPPSGIFSGLADIFDGWTSNIRNLTRQRD